MTTAGLDIKLPTPYKYEEKILRKFEELNKNGKNILNSFLGYREIETIFYLYLFKKYKSNCFLYSDNLEFRIFGLNINIQSRISKANTKLFNNHINIIADVFTECIFRNVKTVIVPLTVYDNKDITHANLLIYRKKFNQIEHFEPHGSYYMNDEKRSAKIKKPVLKFVAKVNSILKSKGVSELSYIPTEDVCPTEEGLQGLEVESNLLPTNEAEQIGYCIPWNMFFTELCLANPNLESRKLHEIITNYFKDKTNIEDYLREVIRGYTFFIDQKVNKYLSIILGEPITTEKINKLYDEFEKNYDELEQIRKSLLELIRLETYMITDKDFNLEKEFKSVNGELRKKGKKDDIELLLKKKILENYEKFNKFTPVTTRATSELEKSTRKLESEAIPEKKCPEGKVLNPKTKRCNKIKINSKTKKNKSSVTFQTI
jgi:hypothetical protein